jgi:predicted permease
MSLRAVRLGLRRLFDRNRADRDLSDEVAHYVELATAEHVRRGFSPEEAARRARVEMGSIEAVKERVRASGWEARVESFWQDVRYAARNLRGQRTFTLAAALTLTLGIGATTAMFSVVDGVLRPLPLPRAHELALLFTDDIRRGLHRELTATLTIEDWQRLNTTFSGLAYYSSERATVAVRDGRQRTRLAFVSSNLFPLLAVPPHLGSWLPADDTPAATVPAVISHALWQNRFGGAADVIGQTLVLDDWQGKDARPAFVVTGVMPPRFAFPDRFTDVWTPAPTYWRWSRERVERFPSWARRWTVLGRLQPDVTVAAAERDFARISAQLNAMHPSAPHDFPGFAVSVVPLLDTVVGPSVQRALWVLMAAVIVVLAIACANVGNLLLARGAARQHELALRFALGASRWRVSRQLLIEALLLAALGGVGGVLLAVMASDALAVFGAGRLPRVDDIAVDRRVLFFAALASLVAGLTCGVLPALRATGGDACRRLRDAGALGGSTRTRVVRATLVAAQCALAAILLVGAGLLVRSLARVYDVRSGFDAENVLVARVEFPRDTTPPAPGDSGAGLASTRMQAMDDLFARIAAHPDVEAVSFIDDLFIAGQGNASIAFPGSEATTVSGQLQEAAVTPQFFRTLHVPLRDGRYLQSGDAVTKIRALWSPIERSLPLIEWARRAVAEPVVVNEAFVARFLADRRPIGERFCVDPTGKTYCYEIVGVVADMHRQGPEQPAIPEYYGPYFPVSGGRADLLVRTRAQSDAVSGMIRHTVNELFPGSVVVRIAAVDADFSAFTGQRRFHTTLLAGFAVLAVMLAAIGICSLVHYTVAQRMRELAVRVSLGARPGQVLRLVLASGLRAPFAGIVLGLLAALAGSRVLTHLMFEIEPSDAATFVSVGATLLAVALTACYLPAHRAARRDPVAVLRLD